MSVAVLVLVVVALCSAPQWAHGQGQWLLCVLLYGLLWGEDAGYHRVADDRLCIHRHVHIAHTIRALVFYHTNGHSTARACGALIIFACRTDLRAAAKQSVIPKMGQPWPP